MENWLRAEEFCLNLCVGLTGEVCTHEVVTECLLSKETFLSIRIFHSFVDSASVCWAPTMCQMPSLDQLTLAWIELLCQLLLFKLRSIFNAVLCNLDQEMNFPCLLRMANLVCHLNRWRSNGFSTRWGMNSNITNGRELAMWRVGNKTKYFTLIWCFRFPDGFSNYLHAVLSQ